MRVFRILIIEDDTEMGELLKDFLSRQGFDTRFADSGSSAMNLFRTAWAGDFPDLVLCDVKMSPIDGLELTEKMIDLSPQLPVILFSAYGSSELEKEALRVGARRLLKKPFGLGEIASVIKLELGKKSKKRSEVKV